MCSKTVTIVNPSGLHARPASDFVAKAEGFDSEISWLVRGKILWMPSPL